MNVKYGFSSQALFSTSLIGDLDVPYLVNAVCSALKRSAILAGHLRET